MKYCISTVFFINNTARRQRTSDYFTKHFDRFFEVFPKVYPDADCIVHLQSMAKHKYSFTERPWLKVIETRMPNCMSIQKLQREKPIWANPEYDYVFTSDLDAVPCPRVAQAQLDFMESGYDIHTIRDTTNHQQHMMGGLSGFHSVAVRQKIRNFYEYIFSAPLVDDMEYEQFYMRDVFWTPQFTKLAHIGQGAPKQGEDETRKLKRSKRLVKLDRSITIAGGWENME